MTKFKKLLSVLLVFVLCFAVCGVIVSAAEDPTVVVYTSYANNDASKVRVTIKTKDAYAAISGTITYQGVTLAEDKSPVFAEQTTDTKYEDNNGVVKYALVTDNFGANSIYGDNYWASFIFDVKDKDAISFDYTAQVADFDATKAITGEFTAAKIQAISTVGTLGAQYRDKNDKYANGTAALRFGAKLERKENGSKVTVDGKEYTAVSCGAVLGFKFNIKINGVAMTDADLANFADYFELNSKAVGVKDGKVTGAKVYQSTKYYDKTADYLAYTFAISGLNTEKLGRQLQNEEIVFMPYTIYQDGDTYSVVFGDAIAQSYTTVNEIYNFVKPVKQ